MRNNQDQANKKLSFDDMYSLIEKEMGKFSGAPYLTHNATQVNATIATRNRLAEAFLVDLKNSKITCEQSGNNKPAWNAFDKFVDACTASGITKVSFFDQFINKISAIIQHGFGPRADAAYAKWNRNTAISNSENTWGQHNMGKNMHNPLFATRYILSCGLEKANNARPPLSADSNPSLEDQEQQEYQPANSSI